MLFPLQDAADVLLNCADYTGTAPRGGRNTLGSSRHMYWTQIDERVVGDVVILDLQGRMTVSEESKPAVDTVRRLLGEGHRKILLNLAQVPFVDSLGIGDIARAFAVADRAGGILKLCGVTGQIRRVLDSTRLSDVIDSFESEQSGLDSFRRSD